LGIEADGGPGVGVAQPRLGGFQVDAVKHQGRRGGPSKIMEPH
jgi:hypothetical protein